MYHMTTITAGQQMLREMEQFARLPMAAQRYIRRSLQVRSRDADALAEHARSPAEAKSIGRQIELYEQVDAVIEAIPADGDTVSITRFMSIIAPLVAFDMDELKLESFPAFSFLYERLLGADARPWLPSAFLMAASSPDLNANRRLTLLGTVTADAITSRWSTRQAEFFPQWIEDIAA